MLSTRERPPANAVKKKSGKINPGSRSDGVVNTLCSTRQATANATEKKFFMSASASLRMAQVAAAMATTARAPRRHRTRARAPASPSPSMIRLRIPSIRYEIGLNVATVRNQSCSIRFRGRFMDERKSPTKRSGKRPCTASPEPVRSAKNAPSAPNAIATAWRG